MKRNLFALVFTIACSFGAYAQLGIPNKDMVEMFKGRTVLVGLTKMDPKEEKKMAKKDPQKLEELKKSYEERNEIRKTMLAKYWPFPNKIEFVDNEQIEAIVKDKDENYAILKLGFGNEYKTIVRTSLQYSVAHFTLYLAEYGKECFDAFKDGLFETNGGYNYYSEKGLYVFKLAFPSEPATDLDYRFISQQFKLYFEQSAIQGYELKKKRQFNTKKCPPEKAKILQDKILLFPKELISVTEQQLFDNYPYRFKILPVDEILKKLETPDPEFATFFMAWNDYRRDWGVYVLDNANMDIIADTHVYPVESNITYVAKGALNGLEVDLENVKELVGFINKGK